MNYMQRIKDLRTDKDMTQAGIAQVLHISQKVYSRYETGTNELPLHHLITICKYYNVSADYILGFTNSPIPLPKA